MGVMRFIVHPPSVLNGAPPPALMTGFDGRTFPMRVELEENQIVCRRNQSDSAKLQVLWNVAGFGQTVLSTASLLERSEPYFLALELARGTVCELRNQWGNWDVAGLRAPDHFQTAYDEAHLFFRRAVTNQQDPEVCADAAWNAIRHAVKAGQILARKYAVQRLLFRQSRSQVLPVSLGCHTGHQPLESDDAERFASVFNSAIVPIQWREIEATEGEYNWEPYDNLINWCNDNRMFVVAGPLLDLSKGGLPEWLSTWQHDFLNLQSFVSDFVETAVSRYVGKIRHWEVTAHANTGGAMELSEENRLSLAARALEVARQVDDEIQLSLRIGQPFGEYTVHGKHRLSPLQFVDALARSGIGLSDAHLEIELGLTAKESLPRHDLQFSKLMDQWSCLGLPLNVTLSFAGMPQDEDMHRELLDRYLPILMAKDVVVGIYWGAFRDTANINWGMLREDGTERPTFARLREYRKQYWRS